ncbi:MAG TPA: hypothetical protein VE008_06940 [Burkholderiales bacterium]|nr:hypothetical protein [Burkholderiales bacterium]
MNIRIVALMLALAAQTGFAQEPYKSAKARAAERAAMLETLQKGKEIQGSRGQYRLVTEVLAVARDANETPQDAIARMGARGDQLLETKGRLVLFRSTQQKAASVEGAGAAAIYPVVLNARTGTFGVLTGALVVKPKNLAEAAAIANSHGLEKGKEYPQLQTVFYRAKAGTDIADAAAALQSDARIESAYPEIIEYVRTPK